MSARWWKGNLHTHTDLSDGDSPPDLVARWYDDAGYDFLAISDHNVRFDPALLQANLIADGRKLRMLVAEELTSWWQGPDRIHALHVNGYGARSQLGGGEGRSIADVLASMIDRVHTEGGWASVNHPNFWSSISAEDLLAVPRLNFVEVYNGHPLTFSGGSDVLPSIDELWDLILLAGRRVFGLAVDDAHYFQSFGPELSNPGRGWVAVWAEDHNDIYSAMAAGNFYASTGPVLEAIERKANKSLRLVQRGGALIEFIADGQMIEATNDEAFEVGLGGFQSLRARVIDPSGTAWVQPVFAG